MHHLKFCYILVTSLLICTMPLRMLAVDVKDFGAKGDGKTDDTDAIIAAINGASDGRVEFPKGQYKISRTIEIELSQQGTLSLFGNGGTGSIVMAGAGPAFRFIGSHDQGSALPSTFKPITWEKERMPLIYDLEIVGAHRDADGLEFRNTMQPVLRAVLIRNVRTGVHLTSRNRNIIISDCHIYNTRGTGIFLDHVNIHQFIISNSHISYCKQGGIKVEGSSIRNFQLTGNDIEYNCDPEGASSADILIDCSEEGSSVREGTISGNTIQAIRSSGSANIRFVGQPNSPNKIGLWSITGNHIGNQDMNIHLSQSRGISIIGNTFMRGYDRNIVVENSKNIIINGNVIDRNEDYYLSPDASGGMLIDKSQHIVISGNILEGSESGDATKGGSLIINDSKHVTVDNNQINDAKFHGIQVINSGGVMVTDCMVTESRQPSRMLTGILIEGECSDSIIRGNKVDEGKEAAIRNKATGVIMESNTIVKNNRTNK